MEFKEYLHIERYGNDEVQGIELGECYIFPKLDGTNGSVWADFNFPNHRLACGSRKRLLSVEDDNAGFCSYISSGVHRLQYTNLFYEYPMWRLYGEWLVPHTFKNYREDAWRKFYVFDIYSHDSESYVTYSVYRPVLEKYGIEYIAPLCVMKNVTHDSLLVEMKNNKYLLPDGEGCGEGIVIKNYGYLNKYGRLAYAKIVSNEFKEKHSKAQPTVKNMGLSVEQAIVEKFLTKPMVEKVYAKIANDNQGWNSKYIPQLLGTVYHDFVTEEIWGAIKEMKQPTINFKTLNSIVIMKIKSMMPELF